MQKTNQTKKVESITLNNQEDNLESSLNTNTNEETENTKNNFFDDFYSLLMTNEGGYVNDENDPGGETYKGIARNMEPGSSWEGWETIDKLKKKGQIERNKQFPELDESVRKFYNENYFNKKSRADEFNDRGLAAQYTDAFVNTGEGNAVKTLREAISNTSKELKDSFKVDKTSKASLSDEEIEYINKYSFKIYDKFKEARRNYYNKLVKYKPAQKKFINGWLNRIDEVDEKFKPNNSERELGKKIIELNIPGLFPYDHFRD